MPPAKKSPTSKKLKPELIADAVKELGFTKAQATKMTVAQLREALSGGISLVEEKPAKKTSPKKTVKKSPPKKSPKKPAVSRKLKPELVADAVKELGLTKAEATKMTVAQLREALSRGISLVEEKPVKKASPKKPTAKKPVKKASPKKVAEKKSKAQWVQEAVELGYTKTEANKMTIAKLKSAVEKGKPLSPKKPAAKKPVKKASPKKPAAKKPVKKASPKPKSPKTPSPKKSPPKETLTKAQLTEQAEALGFDVSGWTLAKLKKVVEAGDEANCAAPKDWRKCSDDEYCSADDGKCYPESEVDLEGSYLEAPDRAMIYSSSMETLEALKKVIKGSKIVSPTKAPAKKPPKVKPSTPVKVKTPPKTKTPPKPKTPTKPKTPSKPTKEIEPSEEAKRRTELLAKFAECLESHFKETTA